MNLASGRLFSSKRHYPVLTGWLNAVNALHNEARGSFTLPTNVPLGLSDGALTLVVGNIRFRILQLQARPSELEGCTRWRFTAKCNGLEVQKRMQANPNPQDSGELDISPLLKASLEDAAVKLAEVHKQMQ